jgi:Protein of unknown function (DUF3455)
LTRESQAATLASLVMLRRQSQGVHMEGTRRLSRFIVACAGVLALCGLLAAAASARPAPQTAPGDPLDPRTYAPDSRLFLVVHAIGVQKYTCQANGTWLFTDPEATLYKTTGVSNPIGTHFLNFATGLPVWQLKDGSSVEAARTAMASGGTGNIAWLLLQAVVTVAGSDGDRLTSTTWVQRLNTSGGVAPAGSCTPGDSIGVAYSADYFFWRAAGGVDAGD